MKEQKSPKKPLLFYYAIVMLAVILFNSMVMPYFVRRQVTDVDYSTFLSQVEGGQGGVGDHRGRGNPLQRKR